MTLNEYKICIFLLVATYLALENAENLTKIQRSLCVVHDPKVIQNVSCWARPFNRSVSVVNMRGTLVQLVDNTLINVQLYKKSEVIFRPFLVNVTEDFCVFMAKKSTSKYLKMLTSIYLPYTNMNHTCPYYPGPVYIKDLPLDANYNVPALWPVGEYRMDVIIMGKKYKIITLEFYVEIKEKPRRWRL